MTRIFAGFTALALGAVMSASAVQAQEITTTRPFSFGVAGGLTVPVGDLGDVTSNGFNVRGIVRWARPDLPINFRGELGYTGLAGKNISIGSTALDGPDTRIFSAVANAMYTIRGTALPEQGMRPYAIGGAGVYNFDYRRGNVDTAGGTTAMGLNAGAGLRFRLAGLNSFAEARYHHVFSEQPTNFIPISFGVLF